MQKSDLNKLCFGALLAVLLTGCEQEPEIRAYWGHPADSEVVAHGMDLCLDNARGPQSTQYNDWDEAIEACSRFADNLGRYCPTGASDCLPQYQRTQADVRRSLPQQETDHAEG